MHQTKVLQIIEETHDAKTIRFERPAGFSYRPGQYCIFEEQMGDELIRRSYSLSSSPTEEFLQITVKHMINGKMSTFLTNLQPGHVLRFNGPVGKFILEDSMEKVVFIAGGSGISPFRGMLKYIIDKKLPMRATLVFGSRSPQDIILRNELEEFNKAQNVKVFLTVDHGDDTWKFHVGFIDINFVKEATKGELFDKKFFIVGPPIMCTKAKEMLLNAGVSEPNVLLDAWG